MTDDLAVGLESIDEADVIDPSPPIAIFLSSESFFQTGQCAQQAYDNGVLPLRFEMPIYYLYCHSMELAMKAFLRAKGASDKELRARRIGHSLAKLWEICLAQHHGFDLPTRLTLNAIIPLLDGYATNFEFRYVKTGLKTLPTLREVRDACARLIAAARPECESTVAGPIPERGRSAG